MRAAAAGASGWEPDPAGIYFSDRFEVDPELLEGYGAFDISVVTDMPLFIDPFLLFNSENEQYRVLHDQIIDYLRFLKSKATDDLDPKLIDNWYRFKEVEQNWLGFTVDGNRGRGLGPGFARSLHSALGHLLENFGEETVTESSHLEKLALIRDRVGRDSISDFTTNLIKHFLLRYTEHFALQHLSAEYCEKLTVGRAVFNYNTETWAARTYTLPALDGDFVLLTPIDLLTKDDTWINKDDMLGNYHRLPAAIQDAQQRALVNNYFKNQLGRNPSAKEVAAAKARTITHFPELIDYYIKLKEDTRDQAAATSLAKAEDTRSVLVTQVRAAAQDLRDKTDLFERPWSSYDEAREAVATFKRYVEDMDGYKVINRGGGKPFATEAEVQAFFGLLLQPSRFDVNREPNNGRGPVDFKVSAGAYDKSLIEFKLAKSSSLARNLQNQVEIYERANQTRNSLKVIICYTAADIAKAARVLRQLGLDEGPAAGSVVVVDARSDNKPSASKA